MNLQEISKKLDEYFHMICRLAERQTELEKKIRDLNDVFTDFVVRQRAENARKERGEESWKET